MLEPEASESCEFYSLEPNDRPQRDHSHGRSLREQQMLVDANGDWRVNSGSYARQDETLLKEEKKGKVKAFYKRQNAQIDSYEKLQKGKSVSAEADVAEALARQTRGVKIAIYGSENR